MEKNKGQLIKSWDKYDFYLLRDKSGKGKNLLYYYFFNPKTGKDERQRISKTLVGKLSDRQLVINAGILAEALIGQLSKGTYNPITKSHIAVTLSPTTNIIDCTIEWLKHRQKQYETNAIGNTRIEASKLIVKHFTEWLIAEKFQYRKPFTFTDIDIAHFLNSKTKEHGWGKETYNSYRDNIKGFFIYLKKLKVIEDNPVTDVPTKNTKNDSTMYEVYEVDELETVHKLLNDSPAYFSLLVASKFLYNYSIRLEEQLKLRVKNYNPQTRLLSTTDTKNGDEANFMLDDEMHGLVMRLIDGYPEDYFIFGDRSKPQAKRLAYGYFGQKWRKFRELHNISSKLKLYALKHSSAFYSLEDGSSLTNLSRRLRHADEKTTRRYTKKLNKQPIQPVSNSRF